MSLRGPPILKQFQQLNLKLCEALAQEPLSLVFLWLATSLRIIALKSQVKYSLFDPFLLPHLVKAFCLKSHSKPLTLFGPVVAQSV